MAKQNILMMTHILIEIALFPQAQESLKNTDKANNSKMISNHLGTLREIELETLLQIKLKLKILFLWLLVKRNKKLRTTRRINKTLTMRNKTSMRKKKTVRQNKENNKQKNLIISIIFIQRIQTKRKKIMKTNKKTRITKSNSNSQISKVISNIKNRPRANHNWSILFFSKRKEIMSKIEITKRIQLSKIINKINKMK